MALWLNGYMAERFNNLTVKQFNRMDLYFINPKYIVIGIAAKIKEITIENPNPKALITGVYFL